MTQEEKAKAYDEAIEKAKQTLEASSAPEAKMIVYHFFPELRDSEDERMIRKIESFLSAYGADYFSNNEWREIEVWLEKQKDKMTAEEFESSELFQLKLKTKYANGYQDGLAQKEQKPAEWSEEDIKKIRSEEYTKGFNDAAFGGKLKEWSEEDVDMLNSCISSIEEAKENRYAYKETDGDTSYDHEISWLKSLRPSWKPSEEQMVALNAVIKHLLVETPERHRLEEIYEQLKKLM